MSLTKDDIKSIKVVVKETVQPMIDKLDESLSIQTARGFAAVDRKFEELDTSLTEKIERLERKVDNVTDDHGVRISNLEKA